MRRLCRNDRTPFPLVVRLASCAMLFALSTTPNPLGAQESGTITGVVRAASSGLPLSGAQVVIESTVYGGLTNADGRFLLLNVPAGTYRLRVELIGFGTPVREVVVEAGQTTTQDFRLSLSALALDEVVVTVTGERRRRELGNAVGTIQADQLVEVAPVHDMSDLLRARTAGVQITTASGATGMGSRIRIRGASSVSLSNEPLLYVDGVRVESQGGMTVWAGGQRPTRLDDINPEDIESVEIVKGPAAATLYGTEAANGVIRITTKQGRPGQTRWNLWTETGLVQDRATYASNYAGLDDAGGPFAERCFLEFELRGLCTQTGIRSYQVLNDPNLSPLKDGSRQQYGLSVTGGSQQVSFYVSAEREQELGPFALPAPDRETLLARSLPVDGTVERPQQLKRMSVRTNVSAQVRPNTTLTVRAGYVSSDLSIMRNDNDNRGIYWSAYGGGTDPDDPTSAWGFLTPAESFGQPLLQKVERFTVGASAQSSPRRWLDVRATMGLDYVNRNDVSFTPRDLGVPGPDLGARNSNYFNDFRYTLDAGATIHRDLTLSIGSETSVGVQYFRTVFEGTFASGEDIVSGSSSIGSAAETSGGEAYGEDKTAGLFVEQTFDVNDRLFLTAALRADDNSAFGRDFDLVYYPKVAVSWVASEEGFFPDVPFLNELRLRGAWGRSGLQPGSTAALTTLDAIPVTDNSDQTVSGVRIGTVGNNLLEPERSSELELGMDLELLGGRLGGEFTFYRKTTDGALVRVPLPPSLGSSPTQWANVGDVLNRGFEAAVNAIPVDAGWVRWDVSLTGSTNHNELLTLGVDVERIGEGGANFVPGYPLGGSWGRRINAYDDADGNGILSPSELTVADTVEYQGSTIPTRELAATSTITLFSNIRLHALLEYRGGFVAGNGTEWFHCALRKCRALVDRSTPLRQQAAAVAAVYHPSGTFAGYAEDGSYTKLREVSVSYTVPDTWATRLRVDRLSVTVAGRNLKTWTDYTGLEPEGNWTGASNFGQLEFGTQPPPRYWTLRFNVGF